MKFFQRAIVIGSPGAGKTVREDLPWVEDEFDEEFRQWITVKYSPY